MSLLDRWDPLDSIGSYWGGSSEFTWWVDRAFEVVMGGDAYRPGEAVPIYVPDAISEIPQTWEDLEATNPELFEPILETRPGRVADSYPQDVSDDIQPEDEPMAHDWGHFFREAITPWITPDPVQAPGFMPTNQPPGTPPMAGVVPPGGGGGGDCDGMTWGGGAPPKGYKIVRDSCGNGVLRKVRRRRRRRMLSASDKTDIAAIVSMVGKGQMASSLINRSAS